MDWLDTLENRSIFLLREAYAAFDNLCMLWSVGKDSTVLLWLARKAFFGHVPFPLVHIDTHYKIPEMIEYRDRLAMEYRLYMIYGENKRALDAGETFPGGKVSRVECCKRLKTEALAHTLSGDWPRYRLNLTTGKYEEDTHRAAYTGVIVGARSDEEGSRSKERYFSPRDKNNLWDLDDQPPEFWNQYKTDYAPGTHVRIHPLLDWTELNVWQYIERERIPTVSLYYNRGDGTLPLAGLRALHGADPLGIPESAGDRGGIAKRGAFRHRGAERARAGSGGRRRAGNAAPGRVYVMTNENHRETINVVTAGHVDHGKSTVIGRLLADTGALPKGKLEAIRENCRRNSRPFEFAFLLDALKNERAQGITIDTARCFFKSEKRDYILIDAPGHVEFLKNMVTGASRAEAALLVIDASRGVEENTRRHGYYLSMLGIGQIAVLVNKIDLVEYRESAYRDIAEKCGEYLAKLGVTSAAYIPVSGMMGDNIARRSENTPWYEGPTVLEQLDAFPAAKRASRRPLRLPVQGVYRFSERGDCRRLIAGEIAEGELRRGDEVVFLPSGKRTRVKSLERFGAPPPDRFMAGEAAGFTMEEEIFVKRGEMACRAGETPPDVGTRLRANLFWLGRRTLTTDRRYFLKCGAARVSARVESIPLILNASDLSRRERSYVEKNEVAQCVLSLDAPMAFDIARRSETLSRFVLVDDYEIAGGGIIVEKLSSRDYDERNIRWLGSAISPAEREKRLGHAGLVVWMTGLSGAGKTAIALEVVKRLVTDGVNAFVLDGDRMRGGLTSDLGFDDAGRTENMRRAAHVASLFSQANVVALVTLISPFQSARARARACVGEGFLEVYVKADIETCKRRDPKGLYKKAAAGELPDFTGIDSRYEPPTAPDLVLDTENWSEEACVEALLDEIRRRLA